SAEDPGVAGLVEMARCYRAAFLESDPWAQRCRAEAAAGYFACAGDRRNRCLILVEQGRAAGELGAYEEAEQTLREVASLADRIGLRFVALMARYSLAQVLLYRGALTEAYVTGAAV